MKKTYKIRQLYGGVFVSIFSDNLIVPWKPLTIGDYIKYHQEYVRANTLNCLLENEIFKKCVVDETLIRQIDNLPAGIITLVVEHIWQFSGPVSLEDFNKDLDIARQLVFNSDTKAIHQIVDSITRAWPYKPEEVYAMDYETLLMRCAMAEPRLIQAGIITEPIEMQRVEDEGAAQDRPKVDAKRLWEEYQAKQGVQPPPKPKTPPRTSQEPTQPKKKRPRGKWWKTSPILEAPEPKKINFAGEQLATDTEMLDNHDRLEPPEMREYLINSNNRNTRAKMIEDAQVAYADVLKALEKRRSG